jgi:hypothetical protein
MGMKLFERLRWCENILSGRREPVVVHLKGWVVSSTEHTTGGEGTLEILGTVSQRGLGGLQEGDIVDFEFTQIQNEHPQEIVFETTGLAQELGDLDAKIKAQKLTRTY